MSNEQTDAASEAAAGVTDESSSPANTTTTESSDGTASSRDGVPSQEALLAQKRALEVENEQLRSAYAAAQRSRYRRTAIALCVVGLVSVGAGVIFESSQPVLFAIGATGLFAGVLTYYFSPTRFVAETIGDRLVEANAATLNAFVQTLGLSGTVVYVPTSDVTSQTEVVAFLPQSTEYVIPTDISPGIIPDTKPAAQGVAIVPVGGLLLTEFTRALTGERATEPDLLGEQLGEALTDQFELASNVTIETATTGETADPDSIPAGRLTVVCADPMFAASSAFDHPIGSFVASGVATALDRPVELRVDADPTADEKYQATVSWEAPS
ncbi:hypothetical protein [Halorubrum halophilum]|uniref:hypothetical protein n=1 Tax=Halorubrum halophilum TaxID=413816 RepID=UPI00186AD04D|nr:hypothetical protein [Halorubrum halophilum]